MGVWVGDAGPPQGAMGQSGLPKASPYKCFWGFFGRLWVGFLVGGWVSG